MPQYREHARRYCFHQAARELLPHALRHQCIDLASFDHTPHQRHGFRCDAEIGEARGKTRNAQDAYRIFGECLRNMPEHPVLQIPSATERINDAAVLGLRGQPSPTSDAVLNARLDQVQATLESEDAADRAIVIMSTLVGALLLSRSVENPQFAQRILDITRAYLKRTGD